VTLTRGLWAGKYEVTQGAWKRVVGRLPGPLTAELPEGDDYPVGNVNFAEAEASCRGLTEMARKSGELPEGWEFWPADRGAVGVRLPGRDADCDVVRRQSDDSSRRVRLGG
jgi:formylglycine-generating enzyme required for sulfatase activity